MADFTPILTDRYALDASHTYLVAEKAGAYATARKALTSMQPFSPRAGGHAKTGAMTGMAAGWRLRCITSNYFLWIVRSRIFILSIRTAAGACPC